MVPTAGDAPQEGAKLLAGRYELGETLGSGGLATVYRGRLLGPGGFARPVAIKRLHAHAARRADAAMFLDEARIASSIAHRNVVATLDVVSEGAEYLVVMELVDGPTFERLLSGGGGPPPLPVALRIVADALRGLHAAHEATDARGEPLHIVHRDVSPCNILVGRDGVARISDFGVAKARGRIARTRNGEVKGHLSYMAPEQVVGDEVDARADVFGAGVVLWEAVTGRRLFHGENEAQIVYALLEQEIAKPSVVVPELPEALDAVLLRALARDRSARFASAHEMVVALEAASPVATSAEVARWVAEHAASDRDGSEASGVVADTWVDAAPATPARRSRSRARAVALAASAAVLALVLGTTLRLRVPAPDHDDRSAALPLAPAASLASASEVTTVAPAPPPPPAPPVVAAAPPASAARVPASSVRPSPAKPHARTRAATPVRLYERD